VIDENYEFEDDEDYEQLIEDSDDEPTIVPINEPTEEPTNESSEEESEEKPKEVEPSESEPIEEEPIDEPTGESIDEDEEEEEDTIDYEEYNEETYDEEYESDLNNTDELDEFEEEYESDLDQTENDDDEPTELSDILDESDLNKTHDNNNNVEQESEIEPTVQPIDTPSETPIPTPIATQVKRMPLITGCGRSGTHSIAEAFTQAGIPYGHEHFRDKGAVSWPHAANDTKYPFEDELSRKIREKAIIEPLIQVVRHPLNAIESIQRCFCASGNIKSSNGAYNDKLSWDFLSKHVHIPKGASRMVKAAHYWVKWNTQIEERNPKLLLHIEWINEEKEDLFSLLQEYYPDVPEYRDPDIIEQFSVGVASSSAGIPKGSITWELLEEEDPDITEEAKRLALHYGYQL